MSHACPIHGCKAGEVPDHRLLCMEHWFLVPLPLQNTITRLYHGGTPKPGYAEACASAVEQVHAKMLSRRRKK